jgi:hypothetical protein
MDLNDGISDFSGGFWSRLLLDEHVSVGLGNVDNLRDRRVWIGWQLEMMQACILCRFS